MRLLDEPRDAGLRVRLLCLVATLKCSLLGAAAQAEELDDYAATEPVKGAAVTPIAIGGVKQADVEVGPGSTNPLIDGDDIPSAPSGISVGGDPRGIEMAGASATRDATVAPAGSRA